MYKNLLLGSIGVLLGGVLISYLLPNQTTYRYSPRSIIQAEKQSNLPGGAFFEMVRSNPSKGYFDPSDMSQVKVGLKQKIAKRSSLGISWGELGPNNIGGRTRAVLIDKDNSDRIFAGSVTGGLFVSNNGGGLWEPINDLMDNLTISCMTQSSNGDIYVGTGSSFDAGGFAINRSFEPMPGGGVFKSTDGGKTFEVLTSTVNKHNPNADWSYINRILVDPKNPLHVYAGTEGGLMASLDGGETWELKQGFSCGVIPGRVDDMEFSANGRLFVIQAKKLFYSDTPSGEVCSNYAQVDNNSGWNISGVYRTDMTVCKSDPNIAYAIKVTGGTNRGFLDEVVKSVDGGLTWAPVVPAPPSISIDSTFAPFGAIGQGDYDLAIEVYPDDCDQYLVGGVELYRASPNWYRAASTDQNTGSVYVHADKHFFLFDPNNSNTLYIASDGGISKSVNAKSTDMRFTQANRGYNVTQFYGMAFTADGAVIAGSQDNGTILVDPNQPGTFMDGLQINGADGFDCEVSNIAQMAIVTSQYGDVRRVWLDGTSNGARELGDGPFNSVVRLWESENDITSKDSVLFENSSIENSIAVGDGITRKYSGVIIPTQKDGEIVLESVQFIDLSNNQVISDQDKDGILTLNGDSVGTIDTKTFAYSFGFPVPPINQSQVINQFQQEFDTGDTLYIKSKTDRQVIEHVLSNPLSTGQMIKVQDPFQSVCATVTNTNIYVTRRILKADSIVRWIRLNDLEFGAISGTVTAIEYTEDGNSLFAATTNGIVYRYDGINDLYHTTLDNNVDQVISRTVIFNRSGRAAVGICHHPNNPEKLLVTLGNYTVNMTDNSHVFEIENALSSTGSNVSVIRDVTGDLIDVPVYDAEYNKHNDNVVLIGTDFGVWSTSDINATNVEWSVENASLANVPVTDIRQQRLEWNEAANHGQIYLATYGRGMWKTEDFVSSEDLNFNASLNADENISVTVFPNPASNQANIQLDMTHAGIVDIHIFDLTGKIVQSYPSQQIESGTSNYTIELNRFPAGTYFVTIDSNKKHEVAKFIVVK